MSKTNAAPWRTQSLNEQIAERKRWEQESARQAELSQTKAGYASLKKDEAELLRFINSITTVTDRKLLAAVKGELAALRDILELFPEEVREAYRAPEPVVNVSWQQGQISALESQIKRIIEHEIPGFDMRLATPITERESRQFPGDPAPHERHYALLREQWAAKLADIERHREEIARLQSEIARIEGK
jgi:hypothetical protein